MNIVLKRKLDMKSRTLHPIAGLGGTPISRREVMRRGLFGAAGLLLADRLGSTTLAAAPQAKAKAVIQIWMWGGPAHLDTFDPKPDAGNDYCGPLNKPIPTNVDGIIIGELLPLLAKQAKSIQSSVL